MATAAAAASSTFDFVIAGAGVAALATARHLAALSPRARIALVSPHAPMSQTSSLSTEAFRDHWPTPGLRAFMQRSIALTRAHAAESRAFTLDTRGYAYASAAPAAARALGAEADAAHGAAGVRRIDTAAAALAARARGSGAGGGAGEPVGGADVYTTPAAVSAAFPFLAPSTTAVLHARNCGWLVSAQTMGMDMYESLLDRRDAHGARLTAFVPGAVVGAVAARGGARGAPALAGVVVAPAGGGPRRELACGAFVNAAGPFLKSVQRAVAGALLDAEGGRGAAAGSLGRAPGGGGGGVDDGLPVFSEVHAKVVFRDVLRAVPRDAPFLILNDAAAPAWRPEELEHIAATAGAAAAERAASAMAPGAHLRPYGGEGSDALLLLWEAWHHGVAPPEPPPADAAPFLETSFYPDVALRGLARLVPALAAYFDDDARAALAEARRTPGGADGLPPSREALVDGGYYTKTAENVPLVGPAPAPGGGGVLPGAHVCGALSGYGLMAAHAAGELAALRATGASALPPYAALLSPERYADAEFTRPGGGRDQLLAAGGGQL